MTTTFAFFDDYMLIFFVKKGEGVKVRQSNFRLVHQLFLQKFLSIFYCYFLVQKLTYFL
jgi:hypothetical protein